MKLSRLVFSMVFLVLILCGKASAKIVRLDWDPTEDAVKYELVIEKGGRPIMSTSITQTEWKGELSSGFHAYRVRAVDAAGRPGEWSEANPIIVMPERPGTMTPKEDQTIELYSGQELTLAWNPVPGFDEYLLELRLEGRVVYSTTVSNSEVRLGELPAGKYNWRVRGVIRPESGYPNISERKWMSPFSEPCSFFVVNKALVKPVLLYPIGEIWPSSDGRMDFRWEKVSGARAYEIRIQEIQFRQTPQYQDRVFRTEDNSISIMVGDQGRFVWSVRPLPSSSSMIGGLVKPIATGIENHWPESQAEFSLQRSELPIVPAWELSFDAGYSFLNFDSIDSYQNFHGTVAPKGIPLQLGAQHGLSENYGLEASLASTFYSIEGTSNYRITSRFVAQYQRDLSFGWYGGFKFGAQLDETPFLTPLQGGKGANVSNLFLLGATAGLQITKLFSRTISGSIEGRVFHPMTFFSGGNGAVLTGNDLLPDVTITGSALFTAKENLGYWLGISWETSSFHWSSSGSNTPDREAGFGGVSLILGAVFRFGSM